LAGERLEWASPCLAYPVGWAGAGIAGALVFSRFFACSPPFGLENVVTHYINCSDNMAILALAI
jgi:hypothetical protein